MQIDKSYAYEITGVVLVVGSAHHTHNCTQLYMMILSFRPVPPTKKDAAWP